MENEVTALSKLSHPNVIRILDEDLKSGWFVTEFYGGDPLSKSLTRFRGNFCAALAALRPVVDAVAQMHTQGLVHRDIKPENIFLDQTGNLILADLGLVYFEDDKRTRVTDTFENVGSRDWMPGWAMGMRIEDIRPTFDVFCLGKVLWAMVAGTPRLRLWYHHDPEFELEEKFPKKTDIRWARKILDRCIVEKEEQCLPSAVDLLLMIDAVLPVIELHAQVVSKGVERICTVCGQGQYLSVEEDSPNTMQNFNLTPTGQTKFLVYCCSNCGHVQTFCLPTGKRPAWN